LRVVARGDRAAAGEVTPGERAFVHAV